MEEQEKAILHPARPTQAGAKIQRWNQQTMVLFSHVVVTERPEINGTYTVIHHHFLKCFWKNAAATTIQNEMILPNSFSDGATKSAQECYI